MTFVAFSWYLFALFYLLAPDCWLKLLPDICISNVTFWFCPIRCFFTDCLCFCQYVFIDVSNTVMVLCEIQGLSDVFVHRVWCSALRRAFWRKNPLRLRWTRRTTCQKTALLCPCPDLHRNCRSVSSFTICSED